MDNRCSEGVEVFEFDMWEHVNLNQSINWTEEDDEQEDKQ